MRISQMANTWPNYYLNRATNNMNKSAERLSSGKRINTAADDPSGLAKLQTMRAHYNTAKVYNESLQSAQDFAKVRDNALQQVGELINKIAELEVSDNKSELTESINAYKEEITNIMTETTFNGKNVFTDDIEIGGISFGTIEITEESLNKIGQVGGADKLVQSALATIGAQEMGIEARININNSTMANMEDSISRIEDVDVEKEMTEYNKQYVLQQMASSMISKQNQNMTSILNLLG